MDTDLRSARKDAGLTLKEVASMFGLSREWLRLVEKGSLVIAPANGFDLSKMEA